MTSFAKRLVRADALVPPQDEHWELRRQLAGAIRELIEETVSRASTKAELEQALSLVELARDRLENAPTRPGLIANTGAGGVERFLAVAQELNPLYGSSNPLAPPLEMWRDDERAWGRVRFGWAFEGPPGHVHGGYIAAVFDQFLGFAQCLGGSAGMTGKLEVRYARPTPLHRELRLEGTLRQKEGRLNYLDGRLFDGDTVTARAKCMFVDIGTGYLSR